MYIIEIILYKTWLIQAVIKKFPMYMNNMYCRYSDKSAPSISVKMKLANFEKKI